MSQHDYVIDNQAGATFRSDLNNESLAIVSNNSGASAPSTTYAYMWWVDTTSGWLKQRNSTNTNWVKILRVSNAAAGRSPVSTRSSNTVLGEADFGNLIRATSAYTQTFDAAATLGDGWWVDFRNDAASDCTLDPNSTEQINGSTTLVIASGTSLRVVCSGSAFFGISGTTAVATGAIVPWPAAAAPSGFLLCDGSSISRSTYATLFALIGTTFGSVDGSTFNLPDMRGRAVFGKDNMGGSAASRVTSGISGISGTTLGAVGGDERMQLHTHPGPTKPQQGATGGSTYLSSLLNDGGNPTGSAGAGASQNMPPAIILNWVIKT